ncbi:MAG: sigma-70 family RNA polymerase sigma factor [Proteobacteria bacterium]|nr:sigma-70 family RNA polymerase sigma factor [Pseudomonadota bacterium]
MTDFDPEPTGAGEDRTQAEALGLSPEVYSQLKQMAHAHLRSYRARMTLNCTALVHEVFLKLHSNANNFNSDSDGNHFLATASMAMRHILVDYARHKKADKRGSGALHLTLQESLVSEEAPSVDLLELNMALEKLAKRDPLLEKLVVLRFFAGLNMEQIGNALKRSTRSVERDWTRARVYLFRELEPHGG